MAIEKAAAVGVRCQQAVVALLLAPSAGVADRQAFTLELDMGTPVAQGNFDPRGRTRLVLGQGATQGVHQTPGETVAVVRHGGVVLSVQIEVDSGDAALVAVVRHGGVVLSVGFGKRECGLSYRHWRRCYDVPIVAFG